MIFFVHVRELQIDFQDVLFMPSKVVPAPYFLDVAVEVELSNHHHMPYVAVEVELSNHHHMP